MMKVWKKILAGCCMAAVLAAMPGMQALASDVQTESDSIAAIEEVASVDEELVGNDDRYVGQNVKASYDPLTGEVVFYATDPEGGTLNIQWPQNLHIDRQDVKSIRVSSGPVYLPAGYEYHYEVYQPFQSLQNLTSLDFRGFDTSKVTNMKYMFRDCKSLISLDLSSIDTSKVTDMSFMFDGCTSLTDLNLSGLNTSSVIDMRDMFNNCISLTSIDLGSFDTSNVQDMMCMFSDCDSLTSLDFKNFRNFKTSNVEVTTGMFGGCDSLTSLDVSTFDTSKVKTMSSMFEECSSLTSLDLSRFNTSNVTDMHYMFQNCSSLTSLNVSSFDTSKVELMNNMFQGCSSLTSLDVTDFNTPSAEYMSDMFSGCSSLTSLDLSTFDTANVINMSSMFSDCSSLENLDLSSFKITTVHIMEYMFSGCSKLKSLDLKGFSNGAATYTIEGMFKNCSSLEYLDISGLDTTRNNFEYFSDVFTGCTSLKTLETPYHNNRQIDLPVVMYDASGNSYTVLPVRYESITLTIYDPTLITPTPTVTPTPEPTGIPKPTEKPEPTGIPKPTEKPEPTDTPKPTEKPDPKPVKFSFSDVQNPNHAYYNAIYWAADAGITKGYPDGTFGIDKNCTRGEMMMFLWRYAGKKEPKAVSKSPFKDVPKTHTFYKAILWGSQKGITKGYSDGTFGVNRNVTRGECMMFLWRLKGKPAPKAVAKAPFPDVPKNHVFYNAVLWGYQKKITTGFKDGELKGKFGVDANCTRGQIVTFLYRAR